MMVKIQLVKALLAFLFTFGGALIAVSWIRDDDRTDFFLLIVGALMLILGLCLL